MKKGFAAGFIAAFIIVAAIAAAIIFFWVRFGANGLRIDTSRPAIVRQVQQLQRLETVVFRMDKIVSGGYESRFLPRFFAGDRLLLLVYGDVTAGVDLGRIDATNVSVSGRAVHLRIPAPEI